MGSIRSAVSFIGNSISGGFRQVANSLRTSLRAQSPPVLSFDSALDEDMEIHPIPVVQHSAFINPDVQTEAEAHQQLDDVVEDEDVEEGEDEDVYDHDHDYISCDGRCLLLTSAAGAHGTPQNQRELV